MVSENKKIPNTWDLKRIGDLGEIVTGSTPKTNVDEYWDGDIPFVSPTDMKGTRYIKDTERTVTYKGAQTGRIIPKNSVMVTCIASIGKLAISSQECITNQQINTIIPHKDYNHEFLYYAISNQVPYLQTLASTTAVPIINKKTFSDVLLPVPPIKEQRRIAVILSSVDEAIEKTEVIIEQTEKVKKGLMQQLLTKGIGHTKFKKTEIGEIPEEWEVRRLDDIFEFYGGMPFSRSVLGDEGAFYLHYGDIHKMNKSAFDTSIDSSWLPRLDISKEEIREYSLLKTGDIVFADASEDTEGIGKSVVIINDDNKPFISGLHTIIAREKEATLDDRYKEYCFSNPLVRKQFIRIATGATVYGISKTSIKQIKIPVPPIEEQRTIAKALKGLDNKIRNEKEKLEPLINIKKGLMQVLLTGKVRVKVDDEVMSQ
ncbi:restriction endonuclease subunit S [Anoxybacillus flavithermus]|uniref:Restriction modification system DNA specificity subunit n=1 Tax=Anoxybacillus flavithermus AK1 TaxID=1297581 RepID=M8CTX3_9BACL|nr:restriction endonuclease subunit S [Anoxybacillus flavithermus]EMT44988.1 restriction modification system DNA specificity subunit [Anoxybacillus flavithermus AK1]